MVVARERPTKRAKRGRPDAPSRASRTTARPEYDSEPTAKSPPLVDVRDCADALIHALESPAQLRRPSVMSIRTTRCGN
jgi:hypothetical protein